jgi:hypothetical protein
MVRQGLSFSNGKAEIDDGYLINGKFVTQRDHNWTWIGRKDTIIGPLPPTSTDKYACSPYLESLQLFSI